MSTRSNIAILNNDGTVTAIYCHWDGYVEYNGRILSEHYQEVEKVKELISGGDLSSLRQKIKPAGEHSFENPQEDVCIYYHRDRDEQWEQTKPKTYESIIQLYEELEDSWIEYLYIYIGGDWYYLCINAESTLKLSHLKSEFKNYQTQKETQSMN